MEEDLTCPVCLELFADPLMMRCSHSVCKACLQDIMRCRIKLDKQGLECPACREQHQLTLEEVDRLPKNLALENIVFRYQEIRSRHLSQPTQLESVDSTPTVLDLSTDSFCQSSEDLDVVFENNCYCGMCEEDKGAEWFCPQCRVLYCQTCLNSFHPSRGALSKHKVKRPGLNEVVGSLVFCPDHTSESVSIFCDTCKCVACHLCVCDGQGNHGSHRILDLETAKQKLQMMLQEAKSDLASLTSSLSQQDLRTQGQMQELKNAQEAARSQVNSQYKCLLFDVTATLNLARQRSYDAIGQAASHCHQHLTTCGTETRTLLTKCHELGSTCDHLLAGGETEEISSGLFSTPNKEVATKYKDFSPQNRKEVTVKAEASPEQRKNYFSPKQAFESKSLQLSQVEDLSPYEKTKKEKRRSKANLSYSSVDEDYEQAAEKLDTSQSRIDGKKKLASAAVSDNTELMYVKDTSPGKSSSTLKNPQGSEDSREDCSSVPVGQSSNHKAELASRKHVSGQDKEVSGRQKGFPSQSSKEASRKNANKFEDADDFAKQRKNVVDNANNQRKLSVDLKKSEKVRLASAPNESQTALCTVPYERRFSEGTNTRRDSSSPLSSKQTKPEEKVEERGLLERAEEVEPLVGQVSALVKQTESLFLNTRDDDMEKEVAQNVLACVTDFHTSALSLLVSILGCTPLECPQIVPAVRSVASPAMPDQLGAPRVQSRILLSWGFNSTTFSADAVNRPAAEWTVNINRNTSQIGDIRTGYIFGVGIATRPLGSKEQIGMNPDSQGIVCSGGMIGFCHNSDLCPIMPLSDLPVAITLSVVSSPKGVLLAYKLVLSGAGHAVCGRRIISLRKTTGDDRYSDRVNTVEADGGEEKEVRDTEDEDGWKRTSVGAMPVFTVSQRVKMQFPQTSDV